MNWRILAVIATLFGIRLLLALLIVPPWQNPDEPLHFSSMRMFWSQDGIWSVRAETLTAAGSAGLDQPTEQAIIRSMGRYNWWSHYGRLTPDPLPDSLQQIPSAESELAGGPTVYYRTVAWLLRLLRIDGFESQFYLLRGLSALLALAALGFAWAATRTAFDVRAAAVVTAILALHPQFVLVSTAVSPDMVVILLGAILWWCAVLIVSGRSFAWPLTGLWLTALGAVFIRRLALPMIGIAAAISAVAAARIVWRREIRSAAVIVAVPLALALMAWIFFPREIARIYLAADNLLFLRGRLGHIEYSRFAAGLFNSSWLVAGWGQYPAPSLWLSVLRVLTTIAAAGAIVSLWRMPERRAVTLAAVCFVAIQMAAVFASIFQGPQGRYLFPVAVPLFTLWWAGIRAWVPRHLSTAADVALVLFMFAFDLSCWTAVLIPAYLT